MILQISTNPSAELAHTFIDLTTACISVIVVLSGVVVYLYKRLEAKNDLFITELRNSNAQLTNVCNSYNQFVQKMDKMLELMVDSKSNKK